MWKRKLLCSQTFWRPKNPENVYSATCLSLYIALTYTNPSEISPVIAVLLAFLPHEREQNCNTLCDFVFPSRKTIVSSFFHSCHRVEIKGMTFQANVTREWPGAVLFLRPQLLLRHYPTIQTFSNEMNARNDRIDSQITFHNGFNLVLKISYYASSLF